MPPSDNTQPPIDDKYAVTSWGGSTHEDLRLPSGQLCLARRVGVQGLLEAGIIHDIDPLKAMIQQHQERVEGKPSKDQQDQIFELLKDEEKTASLFHMLDRILCHVVVKPQVKMTPNDITNRKDLPPGTVYADQVELSDKFYIMTWSVGGAEALKDFRDEYEELVGSVPAEQEPENSTK